MTDTKWLELKIEYLEDKIVSLENTIEKLELNLKNAMYLLDMKVEEKRCPEISKI